MSAQIPAEALQLRSLVRADQMLELFLELVPVPEPGPDEVVIRVEAAPLNPSDMGRSSAGLIWLPQWRADLLSARSSPRPSPMPLCAASLAG
jgi:hypothetical protein